MLFHWDRLHHFVVLSRREKGERLVKITNRLATGAFSPLKTGIWYGIILAHLSQLEKLEFQFSCQKRVTIKIFMY